jgi:hypothetical protein
VCSGVLPRDEPSQPNKEFTMTKKQEKIFDMTRHIITEREYVGHGYWNAIKAIECEDGFSMSVQASQGHYCTPRDNNGPWTEFEVGYPSAREGALMKYAEDKKHPTDTVYGWVPEAVILRIIKKHGGVKRV